METASSMVVKTQASLDGCELTVFLHSIGKPQQPQDCQGIRLMPKSLQARKQSAQDGLDYRSPLEDLEHNRRHTDDLYCKAI